MTKNRGDRIGQMSDKDKKSKITLEDLDWRLQAVTTLAKDFRHPFTGTLLKKGDIIQSVSKIRFLDGLLVIAVPNITALFLNLSYRLHEQSLSIFNQLEVKHKRKIAQDLADKAQLVNTFLEYYFASIVFAYTALESYSNEVIPDDYIYHRKRKNGSTRPLNKAKIESLASLEEKLLIVLPEILQTKFTKRMKKWTLFQNLRDVRHRIIHATKDDTRSSDESMETIWKMVFKEKLTCYPDIAYKILQHFIRSMKAKPRWYSCYNPRKKG